MKKYILILFAFTAFAASAQKERNIWCFGNHAGLDFNSGAPVVFTNDAISSIEGCSSIADAGGKLLFYTEGTTVWNKNNIVMPNGLSLAGGYSSTESALIVKAPGNSALYYIFTTDEAQGAKGFRYSTVDMTLQNGLGDVILKNVAIQSNMSEKLCGVLHANGTDIWIMVHTMNSNGFYAYKLTNSGLEVTPVVSYVGATIGTIGGDDIGYMKFSPNGKKIAYATRYLYGYELFDFDNVTGIVSNPIHFSSGNALCYGLEFSSDNSKLYFSDNSLWQVDLSFGDSAIIVASKVFIASSINWAMQLAPDGKIYIAMLDSTLSVINTPNASDTACGFSRSAINLGTAGSYMGLPNFIPTYQSITPPVAALQSVNDKLCVADCIQFTDKSTNNPTSWSWSFTGATPSSSTLQNPSVCYLASGFFAVRLKATNASGSDSIRLNNFITVVDAPPTPVITQVDSLLYCHSNPAYVAYQWYDDTALIPGATDTSLIVNHKGQYNLSVTNSNGCRVAVGITIVLGIAESRQPANNFAYLYPNPAGNKLWILSEEFKIKMISIYNMLGQSCINSVIESSNPAVDISSLSSGIYFVEVGSEKGIWVKRFVKQ